MLNSTAKAESLIRKLKEHLGFRLQGSATIDTIRETKDSAGWPALLLSDGGNEDAGQPVIAIRIKSIDAVSKDIFGNSFAAFAPHDCDIAYELDGSEAEPSRLDLAKVLHECSKTAAKLKIREIADATPVTLANLDAAAVALEMEFELRWPTKGS
jgi:hypothetical protein